jgi:hypothetical protein
MRTGDLVRVNNRCDAGGLWGQIGFVIGRKSLPQVGRHPAVRVMMDGCERLFDYEHLDLVQRSPTACNEGQGVV